VALRGGPVHVALREASEREASEREASEREASGRNCERGLRSEL
jgi:hypothetical protein